MIDEQQWTQEIGWLRSETPSSLHFRYLQGLLEHSPASTQSTRLLDAMALTREWPVQCCSLATDYSNADALCGMPGWPLIRELDTSLNPFDLSKVDILPVHHKESRLEKVYIGKILPEQLAPFLQPLNNARAIGIAHANFSDELLVQFFLMLPESIQSLALPRLTENSIHNIKEFLLSSTSKNVREIRFVPGQPAEQIAQCLEGTPQILSVGNYLTAEEFTGLLRESPDLSSRLHKLELEVVPLTEIAVDNLVATPADCFPKLRSLTCIHRPELSTEGFEKLVNWLEKTRITSVQFLHADFIDNESFQVLFRARLPQLETLTLRRPSLQKELPIANLSNPKLPALRLISITDCKLGDQVSEWFATSAQLEKIDLTNTAITDQTAKRISQYKFLHLRELALGGTKLTRNCGEALRDILTHGRLTQLVLDRTGVDGTALCTLADAKTVTPLEELSIGDNSISIPVKSWCELLSSELMSNIKSLKLVGDWFTDDHVEPFIRWVTQVETLREFSIEDASITYEGLSRVLNCDGVKGLLALEVIYGNVDENEIFRAIANSSNLTRLVEVEIFSSGLASPAVVKKAIDSNACNFVDRICFGEGEQWLASPNVRPSLKRIVLGESAM